MLQGLTWHLPVALVAWIKTFKGTINCATYVEGIYLLYFSNALENLIACIMGVVALCQ